MSEKDITSSKIFEASNGILAFSDAIIVLMSLADIEG